MLPVLRTGSWTDVDEKQLHGKVDKISSVLLLAQQLMLFVSVPTMHDLSLGAGHDQHLLHCISYSRGKWGCFLITCWVSDLAHSMHNMWHFPMLIPEGHQVHSLRVLFDLPLSSTVKIHCRFLVLHLVYRVFFPEIQLTLMNLGEDTGWAPHYDTGALTAEWTWLIV